MYTQEQAKRFKRIFKRELKYYQTWHGFNLLKFEQDFTPESLESDKVSIKTVLTDKYGKSASELISDILSVNTRSGLNSTLSELENGTVSNYTVNYMNGIGKRYGVTVNGEVSYPFAIHQDTDSWRLDHLPTGEYLFEGDKDDVSQLLEILFQKGFREKMWRADFDEDTFYEVKTVVEDFKGLRK